jgi:RHS repeat-associated protein
VSGSPGVTHAYDALGRRIKETRSATTELYYSEGWQVLETLNSSVKTQFVWSPTYVDAMVLRDRDTDANGSFDQRLYVQQDANFNVTSIVDTSGAVVERYAYDPYGAVTYLNDSWENIGASAYGWVYLHQGGRYDSTGGLYHFRLRDFSPTLGRWLQMDLLRYEAGDMNLYRFVGGGPLNYVDPTGLAKRPTTLEYSCNCGWIDWNHAKPQAIGNLWKNLSMPFNERRSFLAGIGMEGLGGKFFGIVKAYRVDANLTEEERIRVALAIWMELSRLYEDGQWPHPSSYSAEDLPSNIIAFHMAVYNLDEKAIREKCKVVPGGVSDKLYEALGGKGPKNKEFKPVDHNEKVRQLSHCCKEPMEWPFGDLKPAEKGWERVDPPLPIG